MALRWPDKDPDEQLDYTVDWSILRHVNYRVCCVAFRTVDGTESSSLSASDTFNGLTVNRITNTSTTATIVLSAAHGKHNNKLICEITTSTSTKTNAAIVTKRVINLRVRKKVNGI